MSKVQANQIEIFTVECNGVGQCVIGVAKCRIERTEFSVG